MEVLGSIACTILMIIPILGWLIAIVLILALMVLGIFAIIGIINVVRGRAVELPLIGGIRILS